MKMKGEDVPPRTKGFLLACLLVSAATNYAQAQYLTATNWADLAAQAFDGSHSIYLPWMAPGQWRAFSLDGEEPAWVGADMLQACPILSSTNLELQGMTVTVMPVLLTKNVLTGVALVQSIDTTDIIASIAAPSGYYPGILSEDRGVLYEWAQVTNCPDCWGIEGDIPPPTVFLKLFVASMADYTAYESNLEAEAEAEAEAQASSASSSAVDGRFSAMAEGGGGMMLDDISCTITDESQAFSILTIQQDTNHWTTITWESCGDHIYGTFSADDLSSSTVWSGQAAMWGNDGSTSWTDTTSTNVDHRFYKVVRMPPDGDFDGDGMPNDWELQYGLNPLDPSDAHTCIVCDGTDNLTKYLLGRDPTKPAVPDSGGQVSLDVFTPME